MDIDLFHYFLELEYNDFSLENSFSLSELDYMDNYICRFGFPVHPYNYDNIDIKNELLEFSSEISHWLEKDRVEAIKSVKNNTKNHNVYKSWKDIPYDYFNIHFTGFSLMNPYGLLFYTPAILYKVSENIEERINSTGLIWWYFRIRDHYLKFNSLDELFERFNSRQINLIIEFMEIYLEYNPYLEDEILEIIHKLKKIILSK